MASMSSSPGRETPRLPADCQDLVAVWAHLVTADGQSVGKAIRALGEPVGQRIGSNRFYEWRDGSRAPCPEVYLLMVDRVLPAVLQAETLDGGRLTQAALRRIRARLTPPGWMPGHQGH